MQPDEVHISSLIVQAMPDTMPAVAASVLATPGLEIHAAAEEKMVVVLETADEGEIIARISEINRKRSVIAPDQALTALFQSLGGSQQLAW